MPVLRTEGVTNAERYLARLCDRSFLSLWSYPSVYRDQGRTDATGDGKEVCDLLVVCGNHVLIFSDKDCAFPETGNLDTDWGRWYRRAVAASAKQVWGAERWIKEHPNRLFIDRACTRPFPIELPDPAVARYHRIVVAHTVSERCQREYGGTGSLMIMPSIVGADHERPRADGGMPFSIGVVDRSKGFVHVLDDTSLDVLMRTLDTITDFVDYLVKKEAFILSGRLAWAAGEDDLLSYYLRNVNSDGEHDFPLPLGGEVMILQEGGWTWFEQHPRRLAQVEANRGSYLWDELIEKFSHHLVADTQHYSTHPGSIRDGERIMGFMAREPRTKRRMLSNLLVDLVHADAMSTRLRAARVVKPLRPGDPYYVFLVLSHPKDKSYETYREVRRKLLEAYCLVVKLRFPDALDIVGIATEAGSTRSRSEDAVYYDARQWTEDEQVEAERPAAELGLLNELTQRALQVREYPDLPPVVTPS